MISDLKIFPKMPLRQLNFWCIVGLTAILHLLERKTPLFFIAYFILLLSERGMDLQNSLAICHPKTSCI